jgi:hypothetical protein
MSASWTWMAATSGYRAGRATSGRPVNGQSITLAALRASVSVPSMVRVGRNGTPMAAA